MSIKIRLLSSFAAMLLLVSAAAACGESSEAPSQTPSAAGTDAGGNEAAETEPAETSLADTLPTDLDYGGYEFHILAPASMDETYECYMLPTEENGDLLNDTAYKRNREVEERYNVKLVNSFIESGTLSADISKTVAAGSDDYQYCQFMSSWESPIGLIKDGALMNLLDIPEFNIDSPGFYSQFNHELTINDRLYFAFSQFANAGALPLYMVFNKNMLEDYGLDMPYDVIFSGGWTWDVFQGYIKNVYSDLNGNSKMDKEDRFGYANNVGLCNYLVWGFDISVISRTEDGGYTSDILNNKFVSAAQRIIEFKAQDGIYAPSDINISDRHIFLNGNVMFTNSGTYSLDPNLRFIENFDFGIAPYAKFDESQQSYFNYLCPHQFAVPVSVQNPDIVINVAEGLAVLSKQDMTPAFRDVYVQQKLLRDEGSQEIALLLMDQCAIDPTRYYDFAAGAITPVTLLSKVKNSNEVVSKFTSIEEKAQAKAADFFSVFF
ncbi:MAG: hypothetical protein K6D94_03305 [Clostridiales bacterium]|nr:hypothetical protein [Clostridiales bacterium]